MLETAVHIFWLICVLWSFFRYWRFVGMQPPSNEAEGWARNRHVVLKTVWGFRSFPWSHKALTLSVLYTQHHFPLGSLACHSLLPFFRAQWPIKPRFATVLLRYPPLAPSCGESSLDLRYPPHVLSKHQHNCAIPPKGGYSAIP